MTIHADVGAPRLALKPASISFGRSAVASVAAMDRAGPLAFDPAAKCRARRVGQQQKLKQKQRAPADPAALKKWEVR